MKTKNNLSTKLSKKPKLTKRDLLLAWRMGVGMFASLAVGGGELPQEMSSPVYENVIKINKNYQNSEKIQENLAGVGFFYNQNGILNEERKYTIEGRSKK